jgi:hypothetical protein
VVNLHDEQRERRDEQVERVREQARRRRDHRDALQLRRARRGPDR